MDKQSEMKQPGSDASQGEPKAAEAIVEQRKADHIRINVEEDVSFRNLATGLDKLYLMHEALPELDYAEVDTKTT